MHHEIEQCYQAISKARVTYYSISKCDAMESDMLAEVFNLFLRGSLQAPCQLHHSFVRMREALSWLAESPDAAATEDIQKEHCIF